MNKTTFTILILAFTTICFGQATETKYFNSEWLLKEVPQNKAKFSQTIIQNADSTTTTEIEDLKKQAFEKGSDLVRYFELLPNSSPLKEK